MDYVALVIVVSVVLIFGALIYGTITSNRKDREKKQGIARSLGFTPVDADETLSAQIEQAYSLHKRSRRYELKHLSRKNLPDAEMFLFDLIDHSGDNDSVAEQQAVAMISARLNLPQIMIYPKAEMGGWAGGLGNKLLTWAASKAGTLLAFPDNPEFEQRYMVSSLEPELAHSFFDFDKCKRLARIRLMTVQGRGSTFVLSTIGPSRDLDMLEMVRERVYQAMDVFDIFQG
jgi:hypothetical protein